MSVELILAGDHHWNRAAGEHIEGRDLSQAVNQPALVTKAESEISLTKICPLPKPLGFTVISQFAARPQNQQLTTTAWRVTTHLHTTKTVYKCTYTSSLHSFFRVIFIKNKIVMHQNFSSQFFLPQTHLEGWNHWPKWWCLINACVCGFFFFSVV